MSSIPQRVRRRQRIAELCAASLRALAAEPGVHSRGQRLYLGRLPLPVHAPHLRLDDNSDFVACRAVADALALRLRHADAALHRRLRPQAPVARLIFELLEQLRVESLAPPELPGMIHNLERRFSAWSRDFHHSRLTEGAIGQLVYGVAQICWARINARPIAEETEALIEPLRAALAPRLGAAFAGLRDHRRDQAEFARCALEIAGFVATGIPGRGEGEDAADEADEDTARPGFSVLLDFEDEERPGFAPSLVQRGQAAGESGSDYRVFTTGFDREEQAETLVRKAQLAHFRERLDHGVRELNVNPRRLARLLTAYLSVPASRDWRFGEEEGQIDGRRLAQVISAPAERRIFRREHDEPRCDCLVSFLIDCSGSMKIHSEPLALLIDVLTRAMDMAGIHTEILGFTTGAWGGGRAQQAWLRSGRPQRPGRLNEVRYLVMKAAEQGWRRARRGIGVLLKQDLYREGVDGEAVDWACARMLGRQERRRILVVVSDGCPTDSATRLTNEPHYLESHLDEVLARRRRERAIEIRGLGVGLDLSPFYRESFAIDTSELLDNALCLEIIAFIAGRAPR